MAAVAEQMSIERETAAPFLVTQLHAAVLRKKTASSQQPRLPPTLRPSRESVLLNVRLANAWEMVARQGGWKQKPKKPSPPGHQGSLPFAETMAQAPPPAVSSLWGSHIQQPGPGRVATRGQKRLDTGASLPQMPSSPPKPQLPSISPEHRY